MGTTYTHLSEEKNTWIDHNINFDANVRESNLQFLVFFKDGQDIFLGYRDIEFGGLKFQHWFVTNKTHFLEFDSPDSQVYSARVIIKALPPAKFVEKCKKPMDSEVRDRMRHVIGMSNYSLCLRNCEHVANYVFRARWISSQMDDTGILMDYFRSQLVPEVLRKVNSFPSSIKPHIFPESRGKKVYSFIKEYYHATHLDYYLDYNENTYNILVIGPTGGGKSHLINVFFNQPVCDADVSHRSVTREVCFVRGKGSIYNYATKSIDNKTIVVADTIGLCDTEWGDVQIVNMIKGRIAANIKSIDAVFIVFQAGRLEKQHVRSIRAMMNWLGYDKDDRHLNFLFVGTHADNLSEAKIQQLRGEAIEIFKLQPTSRNRLTGDGIYESLVYVGFPPEDSLNDKMKGVVNKSLDLLQPLLLHRGRFKGIPQGEFAHHLQYPGQEYWNSFKKSIPIPKYTPCTIL